MRSSYGREPNISWWYWVEVYGAAKVMVLNGRLGGESISLRFFSERPSRLMQGSEMRNQSQRLVAIWPTGVSAGWTGFGLCI